jgi:hypothetical protein
MQVERMTNRTVMAAKALAVASLSHGSSNTKTITAMENYGLRSKIAGRRATTHSRARSRSSQQRRATNSISFHPRFATHMNMGVVGGQVTSVLVP